MVIAIVGGLLIMGAGVAGFVWWKSQRTETGPSYEEVVDEQLEKMRQSSESIMKSARIIRSSSDPRVKELSTLGNTTVVEIDRLRRDIERDKNRMSKIGLELPAIHQLAESLSALGGIVQSGTKGAEYELSVTRCREALEKAVKALREKRESLNVDNHIKIQVGANASNKMFGETDTLEELEARLKQQATPQPQAAAPPEQPTPEPTRKEEPAEKPKPERRTQTQ